MYELLIHDQKMDDQKMEKLKAQKKEMSLNYNITIYKN